jgi:glycerophosphoryl diester phosphodiesterase
MYFRIAYILLSVATIVSCSKATQEYNDVQILGHVASGLYNPNQFFPENSLEAVEYVLSLPEVAGVELDLQLSEDGDAWLFHDPTLDEKTTGSGTICAHTSEELSNIHYTTINNESIARLSEVDFSRAVGPKTVFLDIKLGNCVRDFDVYERLKSIIDALQTTYAPEVEFIYIANYDTLTAAFLDEGYMIYRDVTSYEGALNMLAIYDVDGFYLRHYQLEKEQVQALQLLGKSVALFEIRSPFTIREALQKHPDYLLVEDVKSAIVEKFN